MKIFIYILMLAAAGCGSRDFDEREWQAGIEAQERRKLYWDNYRDGEYHNPWLNSRRSFGSFLKWRMSRRDKFPIGDDEYLPQVLDVNMEDLREKERYLLWIGHMTYLLRDGDSYYLLDPIFSRRAFFPERYVDTPIGMEDITELVGGDRLIVLITHNHYDHLDKKSIEALPPGTEILVPQGDEILVEKWGDFNVIPMKWWDERERVTFVPAQHWSNRADRKRNASLWGSYILEAGETTFFLGGDSGYFRGFKEIGDRWKIDYAVVSVGAYEPRWFMHETHLNAKESIQVIDDLGAPVMIPGHWGTFRLGDEPPGYPKYQYEGIGDERVKLMDIGETILF